MSSFPAFSGPEICRMEAHEVVELLKQREVSPTELLDATFSRLGQVEPAVNAMPTTCRARAEVAIVDLDDSAKDHPGWLAGLPIGIKDLDRVQGVRTTFGTKAMADHVPEFSEFFVETLEDRGAIIVGKTNTPEMGAGANTFNDVLGTTRNPWDTRMNAAGSSGGAAVSLATGETWLSQGSDHGGSLRTPAAFNGIVGLRPSPGLVAAALPKGTSAGFGIEGVLGPMARSVRDCALFLDAMTGYEPRSPISFPPPDKPYQQTVLEADTNVRIAFAPDLNGFGPVEKEITDQMHAALAKVQSTGGVVVEACP
ncbi:MAG: amidase, partial [Alphaproteobacteria bacterium]|nr:amidase [Alphaproteobacteria bacterium]